MSQINYYYRRLEGYTIHIASCDWNNLVYEVPPHKNICIEILCYTFVVGPLMEISLKKIIYKSITWKNVASFMKISVECLNLSVTYIYKGKPNFHARFPYFYHFIHDGETR